MTQISFSAPAPPFFPFLSFSDVVLIHGNYQKTGLSPWELPRCVGPVTTPKQRTQRARDGLLGTMVKNPFIRRPGAASGQPGSAILGSRGRICFGLDSCFSEVKVSSFSLFILWCLDIEWAACLMRIGECSRCPRRGGRKRLLEAKRELCACMRIGGYIDGGWPERLRGIDI